MCQLIKTIILSFFRTNLLGGWPVVDVVVAQNDPVYISGSPAGAVRELAPVVKASGAKVA
jgi:hypothetical protein